MAELKETLSLLTEQGVGFTYSNFSTKCSRGFTDALTPEWLTWTTRVTNLIRDNFSKESAPQRLVSAGHSVPLVAYGDDEFYEAHNAFKAALEKAQSATENDTFDELLKREKALAPKDLTNKVFIVHGHDEAAKNELEIMLRDMGLEPVVLHRQVDSGMTIIEKFEHHADVGYAFILLTPDEVAYVVADEDKSDSDRKKELRARPNVIWEFGYFVGRLGRSRTCCLHRGKVVLPSDLNGLVYKAFNNSVEELGWSIQKELRALGYKLK